MHRAIVADHHELFRAGLFEVLAGTGEYSVVAGFSDWLGLVAGMKSWLSALVVASVNQIHDMDMLGARARASGSRILLVAEDFDSLNCYLSSGAAGIVHRGASVSVLVEVARKIREENGFVLPAEGAPQLKLGSRLAGNFTRSELTVLALLMEGLKIGGSRNVLRLLITWRPASSKRSSTRRASRIGLELALFLSSRVSWATERHPMRGEAARGRWTQTQRIAQTSADRSGSTAAKPDPAWFANGFL
jgi:DNA-binding NarL/FixJ family response regulator